MIYRDSITVASKERMVTFHDITEEVKQIVKAAQILNGIAVVYSHHTTCSVITQECAFDMSMTGLETLQQDLVNVFEKIIPTCRYDHMYLHPGEKAIGRSESIVLIDGELDLGEFGRIYFIDFDQTRGRKRTIQVQILGE